MKIIYLNNVRGSFARVYTLLRETIGDLYIISGDLLDMPFYSLEASADFLERQNLFNSLRARDGRGDEVLENYVASLADAGDTDDSLKAEANAYLEQSRNAYESMLKKYRILENIFSTKSHVPIYALPGNCDTNLHRTSLSERDLHMKTRKIGAMTIAGCGGAGVRTSGFPELHLFKYNGAVPEDRDSEIHRFLESSSPDIIAVHNQAFGLPGRLSFYGSWGPMPLRNYCDSHNVTMCISGHVHEQWGLHYEAGTLYCNPSSFGELLTPAGEFAGGGIFCELDIENKRAVRITFRNLIEHRTHDLAVYELSGEGYRETLLVQKNPATFRKHDIPGTTVERYAHIPELKIFRDIRNFFRIYQTPQSEERITALNNAISSMGADSSRIALDLVGSVNMGMSLDSSDIDLVLYLRGFPECTDEKNCELFEHYESRLREALGDIPGIQAIDHISLDEVEDSIRNRRYDCQATQRFAAYRTMCRPVNYRLIAPLEDMLNSDIHYRRVVEENIRSYLRVFASTPDNKRSFEKYLNRLTSNGVRIPEAVIARMRQFLESYRNGDLHH